MSDKTMIDKWLKNNKPEEVTGGSMLTTDVSGKITGRHKRKSKVKPTQTLSKQKNIAGEKYTADELKAFMTKLDAGFNRVARKLRKP